MKTLDVYTWKYKSEDEYIEKHKYSGTAYWCLDRQLVIDENGDYRDTYKASISDWEIKEGCFKSCTLLNKEDIEVVDYVCNLNDVEFVDKWFKDDYDVVYDLSHHHYLKKLYAIPKGAKVSDKKILENKKKELSEKMDKVKYLMHTIEVLMQDIEGLEQII